MDDDGFMFERRYWRYPRCTGLFGFKVVYTVFYMEVLMGS